MKKHNKKLIDDVKTYLNASDNQKKNSKSEQVLNKNKSIHSEKSDEVSENFLREEIKSWIKENGELVASKVIRDIVKDLFIKK